MLATSEPIRGGRFGERAPAWASTNPCRRRSIAGFASAANAAPTAVGMTRLLVRSNSADPAFQPFDHP
ncbi:hypothetical protein [Streptomyces sp. NPDC057545]|uniref:hypothetical protein n=1 Tax=Streptomyces sp. NPDC057545 TaxID=3346164 RepID=UPI0036AB84D3